MFCNNQIKHRLGQGLIYKLLVPFISSFIFCASVQSKQHEHNASSVLDREQSLAFSQSVIGKAPADYQLVNQDRQTVSFSDYQGKPLVVNFIYTSCYHTCPVMTTHINSVLEIARDALGDDSFSVVTIGFDTAVDSPERMRLFATQRGIDFNGWEFLSADAETIRGITNDLGFSFASSPKGFDHLAQTTVLDADGLVYRQVYGATFETQALVEPLKELVFGGHGNSGIIKDWINGIKLFCTIYDPSSNRYYFDYSIFYMIAIGLLCLASILVFVVRAWRQHGATSTDKV